MLVKKQEKRLCSKQLIEIIQNINEKKEKIELTINVQYITK
jgi:hypothetical protein